MSDDTDGGVDAWRVVTAMSMMVQLCYDVIMQ